MEKLARNDVSSLLDLMNGRLAFERTGVKLYDSVIEKIERHADARYRPILAQLRHIRDEEREHERWLASQIQALGGFPDASTDMAKLEAAEGSGIEGVICDGHEKVSHLVHALLAAELADNAGWDLLVKLADEAGDRSAKLELGRRFAEEAQHLLFIRDVVARTAGLEVLHRDEPMPRSMQDVAGGPLKKAALAGGAVAALLMGAGALMASMLVRSRVRRRARTLARLREAFTPRLRARLHV